MQLSPFTFADKIRTITDHRPRIGIVLGSGLGSLADDVDAVCRIPYSELEGHPVSTVEGHKGEYIMGFLSGVPVMLMNGRIHYYEGNTMQAAVTPVRVMAAMGCETIILTNAAGGLNKSYHPGTIMCIKDHITSFVPSPLIGPNDDRLGTRFPDMSEVYSKQLRRLLHEAANEYSIAIEDGVYLQITGPAYETPSESALYAALGADAVGMSTACEAQALRHMGTSVLGISCITDMAIFNEESVTTHEEIQRIALVTSGKMKKLIAGVTGKISSL